MMDFLLVDLLHLINKWVPLIYIYIYFEGLKIIKQTEKQKSESEKVLCLILVVKVESV